MLICKNICNRFDWHFDIFNVTESAILLLILPFVFWGSPHWFYENGIAENLQIISLIAAVYLCLTAKRHRELFVAFAFIALFCILREINMGRSIFCRIYFKNAAECRWPMFKYGYLADIGWSLIIATAMGYMLRHEIWKPLWKFVTCAPIYVWDISFILIAALIAVYAEIPSVSNEIMEESAETVMYVSCAICLYKYRRMVV